MSVSSELFLNIAVSFKSNYTLDMAVTAMSETVKLLGCLHVSWGIMKLTRFAESLTLMHKLKKWGQHFIYPLPHHSQQAANIYNINSV